MGVSHICEHGFYVSGCRCMSKHDVEILACRKKEHPHSILVKPEYVANPEIIRELWKKQGITGSEV